MTVRDRHNHRQMPNTPTPPALHRMRRFIVTHNNAKVHGRYPVQTKTSEGCVFTSGHVLLDTDMRQKGFVSIGEMQEVLGSYGSVSIEFIDE